jgi:hypothetical protein
MPFENIRSVDNKLDQKLTNPFRILTTNKNYHLQANTKEEQEKWVSALNTLLATIVRQEHSNGNLEKLENGETIFEIDFYDEKVKVKALLSTINVFRTYP